MAEEQERFDRFVESVREFRDDRDWAQFHDPKSLILALVGEVGELAEL
nr:nucleotide pyrophosphohydrolase [Actinomycetota bacterium]